MIMKIGFKNEYKNSNITPTRTYNVVYIRKMKITNLVYPNDSLWIITLLRCLFAIIVKLRFMLVKQCYILIFLRKIVCNVRRT